MLTTGQQVYFGENQCVITVAGKPDDQPLAADGIYFFVDQYGDQHMAELDADGDWEIVRPDQLSKDQEERAWLELYGANPSAI